MFILILTCSKISCAYILKNVILKFRLNQKYFVSMVGCHLLLKPLIIYGISIVFKKFLMKDLCVIFYGLTLMIAVDGVFHPGVLDILLAKYPSVSFFLLFWFLVEFTLRLSELSLVLDRIFLSNLTIPTT